MDCQSCNFFWVFSNYKSEYVAHMVFTFVKTEWFVHFIVCKFYLKRKQNSKHRLNMHAEVFKGKGTDAYNLFWNASKWTDG